MGKYSWVLEFITQRNKCSYFYMSLIYNFLIGILYNYCISAFKYDATLFLMQKELSSSLWCYYLSYAWKVLSIFCSARAPVPVCPSWAWKTITFFRKKIAREKDISYYNTELCWGIFVLCYNFKTSLNRMYVIK